MDSTDASANIARRVRVTVAVTIMGVGAAVWMGSLRRFTAPAYVAVAVTALVVFAAAVVGMCRGLAQPRPRPSLDRRGVLLWLVLVMATVAWELATYAQSPRSQHPTLSSMVDVVGSPRPLRSLLFGLWLVLGWCLSR